MISYRKQHIAGVLNAKLRHKITVGTDLFYLFFCILDENCDHKRSFTKSWWHADESFFIMKMQIHWQIVQVLLLMIQVIISVGTKLYITILLPYS